MSEKGTVVAITGFPLNLDEATIHKIVSSFGSVSNVVAMRDNSGRFSGKCAVEYVNYETAETAVALLSQLKSEFYALKAEIVDTESDGGNYDRPREKRGHERSLAERNVIEEDAQTQAQRILALSQMEDSMAHEASAASVATETALEAEPTPETPQFEVTTVNSRNLSVIPPDQLLQVITSFKQVIDSNPNNQGQVLQMLQDPTQKDLVRSLVQAFLLMGFINMDIISTAVSSARPLNQPVPPPPMAPPMAPPPIPQQSMVSDQGALIQQILSLTREQIALLPYDQQQQILELRKQYGVYV